ncbi:sirohydrochlorin ferrochelatase [Salibacterium salarium]|uniref:sirohydrochlorin chelatase n=1 Tax=Salibacterium salarium TaxID=284579 RepID=UPI00278712B1|nr:sirohydrochlorin chelatase [Salibacterium salarium]MDQ0300798.1 sirohydrochlorin ferrochelatase [Salibacterium salarium]
MKAVLYVGHGTRVLKGSEQLKKFVEDAKKDIPYDIQETCFLELSEPDIMEGVARCVERGADSIAVIPVLLLSAGHIKEDIPKELEKVQKAYPELTIQYGAPFGLHTKMIEVLQQRLESKGWQKGEDAEILLVGRGSSDSNAISDFHEIASLLQNRTAVEKVDTAFLAAAKPTFDEGLANKTKSKAKSVYVLPYLLFTGLLMQEMEEKIEKANQISESSLYLCDYLGYDKQLIEVLKERAVETFDQPFLFEKSEENV